MNKTMLVVVLLGAVLFAIGACLPLRFGTSFGIVAPSILLIIIGFSTVVIFARDIKGGGDS